MRRRCPPAAAILLGLLMAVSAPALVRAGKAPALQPLAVFNVKEFGASGVKTDNARESIQKAVDACAEAGGGMVYLQPGEYTSGTIHLRSHVRFFIEAGATLFASRDKADYDKEALFYGEDLDNITI